MDILDDMGVSKLSATTPLRVLKSELESIKQLQNGTQTRTFL